jgi:hypothetical protein
MVLISAGLLFIAFTESIPGPPMVRVLLILFLAAFMAAGLWNLLGKHGLGGVIVGGEFDLYDAEGRGTPPQARLERLKTLKDEGLITDAEYEEQRRRILAEL